MKKMKWFIMICCLLCVVASAGYFYMYRSQEFPLVDILGNRLELKDVTIKFTMQIDKNYVNVRLDDAKLTYDVEKSIKDIFETSMITEESMYIYPNYESVLEPCGEWKRTDDDLNETEYSQERTIQGAKINGYYASLQKKDSSSIWVPKAYSGFIPIEFEEYSNEKKQYKQCRIMTKQGAEVAMGDLCIGVDLVSEDEEFHYTGEHQIQVNETEYYFVPERKKDTKGDNFIFHIYVKDEELLSEKVTMLPKDQQEEAIYGIQDHIYIIVEKNNDHYLQKYNKQGKLIKEIQMPTNQADISAFIKINDHYMNVFLQDKCYVIDVEQMKLIDEEPIDVNDRYIVDCFYQDHKLYTLYEEFRFDGVVSIQVQKQQQTLYEGEVYLYRRLNQNSDINVMYHYAEFQR